MNICEIIKTILQKIGSDTMTKAIENLKSILGLAGIVFGFYVGYILLLREFKFSIIKKMIEDDLENRKQLSQKLIQYKSELLNVALSDDNKNPLLSDDFLDENIKKWKELFDFTQSMNSEIANIVHLMYQSQLIIRKTIQTKERNRVHFQSQYYMYYINIIDWLLSICQKARLFPTVWQIIKPYKKQIVFSKQVEHLSSKNALKTDNIVDIGVNLSGVRREILAYCNELVRIRNPILAFSIKDCISLNKYIPRLLYLSNHFYLSAFSIHYDDFTTIQYVLFRYESVHEIVKDVDLIKLYYLPNTNFLKVSSKVFFAKLRKDKNNNFIIKDELSGILYKVKHDSLSFTELYDTNMILIQLPLKETEMSFFNHLKIKWNYLRNKEKDF